MNTKEDKQRGVNMVKKIITKKIGVTSFLAVITMLLIGMGFIGYRIYDENKKTVETVVQLDENTNANIPNTIPQIADIGIIIFKIRPSFPKYPVVDTPMITQPGANASPRTPPTV